MINLNKKIVTKEDLLNEISDLDIYRFYSGKEVVLKGGLLSPLRDETKPSFGYFKGDSGEILFNDFVLGKGDCIKFVQLKFGLTFFEALSKVVIDFNLNNKFEFKKVFKTSKMYDPSRFKSRNKVLSEASKYDIQINSDSFDKKDYDYWSQYNITPRILGYYEVFKVKNLFLGDNLITPQNLCYAFREFKDNKLSFKIYQPFSSSFKWITNHNESVWQGWRQLPKKGKILIITKSLKDVMTIVSNFKLPATSLQAESVIPKDSVIEELKERFENIFLLYDNDYNSSTNWGRKLGKNISEKFNIPQIEIPEKYKSKDISDLIKNHGKEKTLKVLKKIIKEKYDKK